MCMIFYTGHLNSCNTLFSASAMGKLTRKSAYIKKKFPLLSYECSQNTEMKWPFHLLKSSKNIEIKNIQGKIV